MSAVPRVLFFGTPAFAVPTLRAVSAAGWDIRQVITQPDSPAGRGQKLTPSPIRLLAESLGLTVVTPASLRTATVPDYLTSDIDAALVVAYGKLIPTALLHIPRIGFVNIHPSLLPRWRGASPIQSAILAGDATTGISLMQLDAGQDTGPLWEQEVYPIHQSDTAETLSSTLADLAARIVVRSIPSLLAEQRPPMPQTDVGVTHTTRLTKESGRIDWRQSAEHIARQIRAYTPWPGSWTILNGSTLKILAAHAQTGSMDPGSISSALPLRIGTSQGVLEVTAFQFAGGRALTASEAVRGNTVLGQRCS